jgi:hypothetical protein
MFRKSKLLSREKLRPVLFFGFTVLIGVDTAVGQPNDPCDCSAVLVNAIYENRVERGDRPATTDLASYLCGLSNDNFKKLLSKSGRTGFEVFSLSGSASETEFNQVKSELQKRLQITNDAVSSQRLLERHADLTVWEKWSECRANCNREGVNCWIKNAGYGSFVLYLDYIVQTGEQSRTVTLRLTNAESLLQEPMQFQLTPGITTRSIHRKDEKIPVEIKVETAGGNQDFAIQPDLPVPEATPTPIITPTPVPTPTPKATPTPAPTAAKKPATTPTPTKTQRRKHHGSTEQ